MVRRSAPAAGALLLVAAVHLAAFERGDRGMARIADALYEALYEALRR